MKSKNYVLAVLFLLASLALGACGGVGAAQGDPVEGTSWELFAISKRKPISGSTITLSFEDGQVSGSAGCNQYFGSYQVDGEAITIQKLAITEMACMEPAGLMEQENLIMEFLNDAQRYQLEDSRLMIFRPDGEALTFDRK